MKLSFSFIPNPPYPFSVFKSTGQCIKSSPGLCFLPETLPRPSISAWPSWVVPAHSMVTLRCLAPMGGVKFILRKNNVTVRSLESSETTEARAELRLTHLQNSAAGVYTCEYYISQSPGRRSPPSDVLLLVTGEDRVLQTTNDTCSS